jgi:hypothetical protein
MEAIGNIMSRTEIEDFFSELFRKTSDMQLKAKGKLRRGQCLVNALNELNPELAELITAGDTDCFYDDHLIPAFTADLERRIKYT